MSLPYCVCSVSLPGLAQRQHTPPSSSLCLRVRLSFFRIKSEPETQSQILANHDPAGSVCAQPNKQHTSSSGRSSNPRALKKSQYNVVCLQLRPMPSLLAGPIYQFGRCLPMGASLFVSELEHESGRADVPGLLAI